MNIEPNPQIVSHELGEKLQQCCPSPDRFYLVHNLDCNDHDIVTYRELYESSLEFILNTFHDPEIVIRIMATMIRIYNLQALSKSNMFCKFYKNHSRQILLGEFNYDDNGVHKPGHEHLDVTSVRIYDKPNNT